MNLTAAELARRAALPASVPVLRVGTVTGTDSLGRLLILLDGTQIVCPADRRLPAPTPGPVVLLAVQGQYVPVAFPAQPTH